ncbi:MAG: acetyl-CoA carboxylase carboxyltransferase subunit beta [Nitrospinae bacterium]|nr:acetyl-CoA carboxylase carboxyltransferase subunit beta [Nitrospinota bacterium]
MELNLEWLKKARIPIGLYKKCENCKEILDTKDFIGSFNVCPNCQYHHAIPPQTWTELLFEENSFIETEKGLMSTDPLKFRDSKKYKERLKGAIKKTGNKDAIVTGIGKIGNHKVSIAIFDFTFMGGSMGIVVGEKITRAVENAITNRIPMIIISSSGGARMQEGILSLMQMAKTSAALKRLSDEKLLYISILSNPTTGGVTASFAMLGDIHIAEPGALICFAGPRVIKQTIRQSLPDGFQTAEFSLEHGFVDMVVSRIKLRETLKKILSSLL